MVQPSDPIATARRDGYLERAGVWGEVTIGSLLAGEGRTDIWEVVDTAHGPQVIYGYTLWFRVVNQITGETHAIEPKLMGAPVKFLMRDDLEAPPPATPPGDAEKIMLLVTELGATHIATLDRATGEVQCPGYAEGFRHTPEWRPQILSIDELEHLKICHGLDVSGIETIADFDEQMKAIRDTHGPLHSYRSVNRPSGGFPHRHVPEEHDKL